MWGETYHHQAFFYWRVGEEERHGDGKSYWLFHGCLLVVMTESIGFVSLDVRAWMVSGPGRQTRVWSGPTSAQDWLYNGQTLSLKKEGLNTHITIGGGSDIHFSLAKFILFGDDDLCVIILFLIIMWSSVTIDNPLKENSITNPENGKDKCDYYWYQSALHMTANESIIFVLAVLMAASCYFFIPSTAHPPSLLC